MARNASPAVNAVDVDDGTEQVWRADRVVIERATRRALARHQAAYTDEVRRLLEAGLAVMRRCGTTRSPRVADILGEAGLSRDAFYRHFASKEDLVAAIVEAGAERLVGYLRHQMSKESDPADQLERWIHGVLSQAANPEVAHATRAVLWNGGQIGDGSRSAAVTSDGPLAELIVGPLAELGSVDSRRDAALVTYAAMGLMRESLWQYVSPSPEDEAHLLGFCTAAVGAQGARAEGPGTTRKMER